MNNNQNLLNLLSWLFGIIVFAIGLVNLFWGNDPGFGAFLLLLSLVYFPPANAVLRNWTGFGVHRVLKIFLGVFIIWASLGVGELFDKIDLMISSL